MAVSKRLRFEILRRDNYTCRYCGAKAPDVPLRVDHVLPETLGGTDDPSNLVTACEPCNSGKTSIAPDSPMVTQVAADAERWARALQLIADDRRAQYRERESVLADFYALWEDWRYPDGEIVPLPTNWRQSVTSFYAAGLTWHDMDELIRVAMTAKAADTWKYFCGCCWTRVRESHAIAALLLEVPNG